MPKFSGETFGKGPIMPPAHGRNVEAHDTEEPADGDELPAPTDAQKMLAHARENFSSYRERYERTINGYFATPDMKFTMKPGGWYIDLENIEVNADPNFFIEKGYTESESLFVTFHEAEHFHDMVTDPDAYTDLFDRIKTETDAHPSYPQALSRMYNCLDDILVNRSVMAKWPAGRKVKDRLYPKLFPQSDLRQQEGKPVPRHRQFMYALLRSYMLPDELVEVDDEVRQAISQVEDRGKGKPRFVDLITSVDRRGKANFEGERRFALVKNHVEDVFKELYKKDLEDRKGKSKEKGGQGIGSGVGDPFDADPFEDAIPDPMDFDDVGDMAQKINDAISKKKSDTFKNAMGVDQEDFDLYRDDFDVVKKYVDELSKTFDEIIERRKSIRRVLRKSVKEGVMLDPRKIATGVAEIHAGNYEPRVMLDFEKKEMTENLPTEIEFTLVCDGSGSMQSNNKDKRQRQLAILAMEALATFRDRVEKARRGGDKIDLKIKSEARIFSDFDHPVKALGESLTHAERVGLHMKLRDLPGKGNNEPATFDAIRTEQMNKDRLKKLANGSLKKIILFLTDGQTEEGAIQGKMRELMDMAGTDKKGKSHLVIAGIGFADGIQAVETYAPNGFFAEKIEDLPKIFEEFLKKILSDV